MCGWLFTKHGKWKNILVNTKEVAQPEIAQRKSDITFAIRAAGKSLL